MRHFIVIALSLFAVTFANGVEAQSLSGSVVSTPPDCVHISRNLYVGLTDVLTEGQVGILQNFLVSQGYFDKVHLGTGRFGPITRAAVIKFQQSREIPATGFVGPLTRAAINSFGCGVNPGTSTVSVAIWDLSPGSGEIGDTITITGEGFTTSNTVLIDNMVAAQNLQVKSVIAVSCLVGDTTCHPGVNQTLEFTIPNVIAPNCPAGMFCAAVMRNLLPGKYLLTVRNDNGTSNVLVLTVTP